MGRGLVEPLDDMRVTNPPSNKPLLDALSARLVGSNFDLRDLVREICTSRVYQLSAKPNATNISDNRQFSRSQLRRMRADVLLDAVVKATDSERDFSYFPKGIKAIQQYPRSDGDTNSPQTGDSFFTIFGRAGRASICADDTKMEPTRSQTLHFIAGETVQKQINGGQIVPKLLAANAAPEAIIEELYIRTLSRKPGAEELEAMLDLVGTKTRERKVYEDIFFGLLNSTEFLFNH